MILHFAGPLVEGVQRCTRCGAVLVDLTNCAWPEGEEPPGGYPEGDLSVDDHGSFSVTYTGLIEGAEKCGTSA